MNILIDTHTHTVASGHHTTDTITDLIKAAKDKGLSYLGITDHSFGMLGAAKESYFINLSLIPKKRMGVNIMFGAECNIMDSKGKIDLSNNVMSKLDYCIASLHKECFKPSTEKDNTDALINAMKNKFVNIIGHPENDEYPVDFSLLCESAADSGTIIELNSASIDENGYRGNQRENAIKLLTACKNAGAYLSLGSDSHGKAHVGDFKDSLELLATTNFPENKIVNGDINLFKKIISSKREIK